MHGVETDYGTTAKGEQEKAYDDADDPENQLGSGALLGRGRRNSGGWRGGRDSGHGSSPYSCGGDGRPCKPEDGDIIRSEVKSAMGVWRQGRSQWSDCRSKTFPSVRSG